MANPEPLIPRLRGVSHAIAFVGALGAALFALAIAPSGRAAVALAIYGAGLVALFGCSAFYHRWHGSAGVKAVLRRVDHSTIFVFIAASYTPIALLTMHGAMVWVLLGLAWLGAAAGVALTLGWVSAPRAVTSGSYLALGWVAILALPQLVQALSLTPLVLLLAGGVLYSIGAIVYATQRPDPWPRTFGFHEIFHLLVIAAAVAQYVAIVGWVAPTG